MTRQAPPGTAIYCGEPTAIPRDLNGAAMPERVCAGCSIATFSDECPRCKGRLFLLPRAEGETVACVCGATLTIAAAETDDHEAFAAHIRGQIARHGWVPATDTVPPHCSPACRDHHLRVDAAQEAPAAAEGAEGRAS